MADWMRKQLEELMGAEALGRAPEKLTYEDPKVCRDFLCGLCPHDLFTNTKSEVGPCTKQHADKYKIEYEAAKKAGKHPGFEPEHVRNLDQFVSECDRRIQSSKNRLERSTPQGEDPRIMELVKAVNDLNDAMTMLINEIERLGEEGEIDRASKFLDEVDRLKREKEDKDRELRVLNKGAISQQQKLRVCEVCGAHLSVYDSDRRLADHFGGKMHLGYVQIRERLDKLKVEFPTGAAGGGFRGAPPGGPPAGGGYPPRGGGPRRYEEPYSARGPPPYRGGGGYRDDYYRDDRDRGYGGGYGRPRSPGRRR